MSILSFAGTGISYDDANCQAAWLMDVSEDPIRDDSQNTNTGAHQGDPTHATAAPPPGGFSTGYYILDQVVDSFDITDDPSLDISGDYSIVAWIYPVSFGDNSFGRIFDKEVPSVTGYSWYINDSAISAGMTVNMSNGGQTLANSDADIITTGTWQHVAAVFGDTANTITFYVNGVEKGTPAMTRAPSANAINATIGDRNDNARQFDGRMDEVAFFDRTTDSTEINDLKDNGLAPAVVAAAAGQVIIIMN